MDVYHRVQPPPITLACGITGGAIASPEFFKKIRESFNFDNMKVKREKDRAISINFILVFLLIEIIKVFEMFARFVKKKKEN